MAVGRLEHKIQNQPNEMGTLRHKIQDQHNEMGA